MGEPRPGQGRPAGLEVRPEIHVALAVIEILPAAVAVHEVDAAAGTPRIQEQPARIDPLPRELLAHHPAGRVVPDRAEERGAPAEGGVAAARVGAGLADGINVLGEVGLDGEIDIGALQVDARD
jgi:hypothetical protein